MVWLPEGDKILKICLFVSTESTNVTDGQTDIHTPLTGDNPLETTPPEITLQQKYLSPEVTSWVG